MGGVGRDRLVGCGMWCVRGLGGGRFDGWCSRLRQIAQKWKIYLSCGMVEDCKR